MTTIQAECEAKSHRTGFGRPRLLLLGTMIVAAVLAAAMAASRHYGFGGFQDKFKLAVAALDRGDFALARSYARELKASQQTAPRASFLRGAMLLERGCYYPALDLLGQAKQDPDLEAASLTLMGQAWYRLGLHLEAQAALHQVLKREPDSVEAHRWLAASYYDLGVIDKAMAHLERTADLDRADPRPHRLLGLIHKDFEQYEDAIPFYEESLRRKSDQEDAREIRLELAGCQIEIRRYRDALATLEPCSDRPEVNVLRAKCHHGQGDVEAAEAALARALEQEPDNFDALLLRGTMLLEDGDARAALEALGRAIELRPKDYMAHFRLAQAYAKSGEHELADAEQKQVEEIRAIRHEFSQLHRTAWENPGSVQVRLRLAELARQLGRPDLAEVWLRSAAALQPATDERKK